MFGSIGNVLVEPCRTIIISEAGFSFKFSRNGRRQRREASVPGPLSSSLTDAWQDWRLSARVFARVAYASARRHRDYQPLVVVDEIAGQYEENFDDVGKHLIDYFTFKAVRTVLGQLYEMNPTQYMWFYNYVVDSKPNDGKRFLRDLVKERQELGERVMVTRLHLFNKWVKRYNHGDMHRAITDQNLELMRERLVEIVKWPSDNNDPDSLKGG